MNTSVPSTTARPSCHLVDRKSVAFYNEDFTKLNSTASAQLNEVPTDPGIPARRASPTIYMGSTLVRIPAGLSQGQRSWICRTA
jgi:hypothetical protein